MFLEFRVFYWLYSKAVLGGHYVESEEGLTVFSDCLEFPGLTHVKILKIVCINALFTGLLQSSRQTLCLNSLYGRTFYKKEKHRVLLHVHIHLKP